MAGDTRKHLDMQLSLRKPFRMDCDYPEAFVATSAHLVDILAGNLNGGIHLVRIMTVDAGGF
jgi:hypothetical protein